MLDERLVACLLVPVVVESYNYTSLVDAGSMNYNNSNDSSSHNYFTTIGRLCHFHFFIQYPLTEKNTTTYIAIEPTDIEKMHLDKSDVCVCVCKSIVASMNQQNLVMILIIEQHNPNNSNNSIDNSRDKY